jgi:hypothetical protein
MPRTAVLCLLLLIGACAAPSATPAPELATSCSGVGLAEEGRSYPGWPPEASSELVPIPVSSELAVGENRFLLNLLDAQNQPLASPERDVEMTFYDLASDPATPSASLDAVYLPTAEGRPGLYRASPVSFPCWGEWGLEVVARENDGSQRSGRMIFPVRPTSTTPAIGGPAPASDNPTATSADEIAAISTDTEPDPDFYRTSVADALDEDSPFLVIFATPAFCRTLTCGPALDIVKSVASDFKGEVAFIHVEPYQLEQVNGNLQPVLSEQNEPIPIEAVLHWGLPSEPYIFVVDSGGEVTAKLEGVASAEEIETALGEVAD